MPAIETSCPPGLATLDRWDQLARLSEMLPAVLRSNPFWQARLAGAALPRSAEEFRRLPLTSNQQLSADMREHPPFGTNLTYPVDAYVRYHQTSGTMGNPLIVLDTARSWDWWCDCWDVVLDACGVRRGDRAFFAFSFAPFIGFWSAFDAVTRRRLLAVPGGGATTGRRLRLLLETGCTVLFSTPTYALHMAEIAEREGIDTASSPIRRAILAGEPGGSLPDVRRRIEDAWGAAVFDHAGASEVGAYGIPCPDGAGVYVNEREFVAEVLEVGNDRPVSDGQAGELVLTNLGRWGCPVVRYRTGDLVRPVRTDAGLLLRGGVLGRIDQMMLVRGVNLHPSGIEGAVRRVAGRAEFRITVARDGEMDEVVVEAEATAAECRAIAEDVRSAFGVRVTVRGVPFDSLPRWQAKARRFRDLRK